MPISGFFTSFFLVAASEMGDKTQLLAFTLAARFKKPWPIMGGILTATLLNHSLAAWGGSWVAERVPPGLLKTILAVLFIGFGLWILIPDKENDIQRTPAMGPYLTTVVLFFLAEMGDKTQLATIALGARFDSVLIVTAGTTLGMLVSDGLAVLAGEKLAGRASLPTIRWVAAGLFIVFGLAIALH